MGKQTRDERVVAANDLVAGVQHYFTATNTSLTVAGVTMPPAAVIATLQSRVKAADATAVARANLAKAYADELVALERDSSRVDLAERLELGDDVLEPAQRQIELTNFIERLARPFAAQRGRG